MAMPRITAALTSLLLLVGSATAANEVAKKEGPPVFLLQVSGGSN